MAYDPNCPNGSFKVIPNSFRKSGKVEKPEKKKVENPASMLKSQPPEEIKQTPDERPYLPFFRKKKPQVADTIECLMRDKLPKSN